MECFKMLFSDEKVVRGCIVDLQDEVEKSKCMANDQTCKTCYKLGCNLNPEFSSCYTTDTPFTKELPPFEYDTKSSPKQCTNYVEKCFTQVLDDETVIRGCLDDYIAENDKSPDFLDNIPRSKNVRCTGNLCNSKIKADFCITCNSTSDPNCANSQTNTKCPLEANRLGCYHFANETYIEKGCAANLDDNLRVKCITKEGELNEECIRCYGDNCNNRPDFLTCYSSDDADYRGNPKKCRRYDDECFIHASGDNVRRGCVSDVPYLSKPIKNFFNDCTNSAICRKCTSSNCNEEMIKRERCLSCSADVDGYIPCKFHPDKITMEVMCPFTLEPLGCYLSLGQNVSRGCTSTLNTERRLDCVSSSDTCKTCNGENCNEKEGFQVCTQCSSEIDGVECISGLARFNEKQCSNYTDKCFIQLRNGDVTRGCIDCTKTDCEQRENFAVYSNYGENRKDLTPQTCMICDSQNNKNCTNLLEFMSDPRYFKQCDISIENKGCYHYYNNTVQHHIRGIDFSIHFNQ